MSLYRPVEEATDVRRFKIYRYVAPISLSDVLPMLQHMGVRVVDERPYHVDRPPAPAGAGRRAGLARGQRAARLQPVPAPGRHPPQPLLHVGEAVAGAG